MIVLLMWKFCGLLQDIFCFFLVVRSTHFFLPCLKIVIAAKMKFRKTKCSYFISYGLAPYIKEQLEKYTSSSLLYVVSIDESMNSILQNEQMDVAIQFWNNSRKTSLNQILDVRISS